MTDHSHCLEGRKSATPCMRAKGGGAASEAWVELGRLTSSELKLLVHVNYGV